MEKSFLEELVVAQLVKKFPTFYGTRRFITMFTSAGSLPCSQAPVHCRVHKRRFIAVFTSAGSLPCSQSPVHCRVHNRRFIAMFTRAGSLPCSQEPANAEASATYRNMPVFNGEVFSAPYRTLHLECHSFVDHCLFSTFVAFLVARYLRASFTVTNTRVGGQPALIRRARGSDSAQGVLLPPLPCPSSHPSYCDVAQAPRYFVSSIPSISRGLLHPTRRVVTWDI
jgi:hypothetical protein